MLKYYKVDGDGKIERLRRECPQEGVSIFLSVMLLFHQGPARLTLYISSSVVLVSLWPLCTTASTVGSAISPTSLMRLLRF